jgi:hypothetical protein
MVNVWNENADVATLDPMTPENGGGGPARQYLTASSRLMLD